MIEEYLRQRLSLLTNDKKKLKDSLIEIRSSLHETKLELDDYMSSTSRPFEPFNPRRNSSTDDRLSHMNEKISKLSSNFEDLSARISSLDSEINVINQCLDEYESLIFTDRSK